ncbi:MAG: porin family protein [Flavobacteriaceae bacterium]|nr:porin family protein [Flavobacteriaceae bacterium]
MGAQKKLLRNAIAGFIFLFISQTLFGQFYHGIEFGVHTNNADFMIGESGEPSSKTGFFVGYVAERDLNENLFIRLGINFNRREFDAVARRGINTSDETWGVDVIEIPVNLGYYLNWNRRNFQFFIDAGINLGYNNRAITENEEETIRLDIGSNADVKRFGFGANGGVGVLIKKRVKLRLSYYTNLSSIVNTEGDTWKNKTFGVSINYFLKEREVY